MKHKQISFFDIYCIASISIIITLASGAIIINIFGEEHNIYPIFSLTLTLILVLGAPLIMILHGDA
jgi:hypothetical protein